MNKILIIEDDKIVTNIYRNKLVLAGYTVECAHDGEHGLEALKHFKPDALILDLMLPGLSGIEVLKSLRADQQFEATPVIVLSNTYLTSMVQEAWKAGATKCLSKASSTPNSVIDVIRGLLGSEAKPEAPAQPYSHVSYPSTASTPQATPANDQACEPGLCENFLETLPVTLTTIRVLHQKLVKAPDEEARVEPLQNLFQEIHMLNGGAGLADIPHVAQMSEALEALIKELRDKPKTVNASTLRTLASAIDLLGALGSAGQTSRGKIGSNAKVLVVDDDAISRRAVSYSLRKARLNSVTVEDPKAAIDLLSQNTYDLIVLDVEMPEVNGFELCSKLRGFSANKRTPVVFVTALNSFESRANSSMSGGNDFIGKPFLFIELGVKALVQIWRTRLTPAKAA